MGMKSSSNMFAGTSGSLKYQLDIQYFGLKNLVKKLPKDPNKLFSKGWIDVTNPAAKAHSNSTEYINPKTKHRLRFDKGNKAESGYKAKDHYHVYNPNATSNKDLYLNSDGKPVKHGSKQSHLFPK